MKGKVDKMRRQGHRGDIILNDKLNSYVGKYLL